MIGTRKGNLLDAKGIIVHGCNCQGAMGSGVAKAIRAKWPVAYERYKEYEGAYGLRLGCLVPVQISDDLIILNALTQEHYGGGGYRYVSYDAVEECFKKVIGWARGNKMPVNFPLIGAGLGGGDWEIISTIIDRTLGDGIEKILWVQ